MQQRTTRIAEVNRLLPYFAPCLRLEERKGRLWLVYAEKGYEAEKAAVLSRNGCSLACQYGVLGMGGTRAMATTQLIRYVRDLDRLPIGTWRNWCRDCIGLGRPDPEPLLEALVATAYGDPEKTGCIFCGTQEIEDWWSVQGGPTGPCCSGLSGCKKREQP